MLLIIKKKKQPVQLSAKITKHPKARHGEEGSRYVAIHTAIHQNVKRDIEEVCVCVCGVFL